MIEWSPNSENEYPFQLVDANISGVTGLGSNFMFDMKLPGASVFIDGTGSKLELGSGWYKYISPIAESASMGIFAVSASGVGTTQQNLLGQIGNSISGLGAKQHTININVNGTLVENAEVWITRDSAGNQFVAGTLTTNSDGNVTFYLDPDTYYAHAKHSNYNLDSPKQITVS